MRLIWINMIRPCSICSLHNYYTIRKKGSYMFTWVHDLRLWKKVFIYLYNCWCIHLYIYACPLSLSLHSQHPPLWQAAIQTGDDNNQYFLKERSVTPSLSNWQDIGEWRSKFNQIKICTIKAKEEGWIRDSNWMQLTTQAVHFSVTAVL